VPGRTHILASDGSRHANTDGIGTGKARSGNDDCGYVKVNERLETTATMSGGGRLAAARISPILSIDFRTCATIIHGRPSRDHRTAGAVLQFKDTESPALVLSENGGETSVWVLPIDSQNPSHRGIAKPERFRGLEASLKALIEAKERDRILGINRLRSRGGE